VSFLSTFAKVLKIGGSVAPGIITAVNPAAGAITSLVVNAVIQAEEAGGSGPEKKQAVMAQVAPMVAPMVGAIMQATGSKVIVDPAGVNQALSQTVDGVVALLNAIKAPAAASASTVLGGSQAPS
jgi:hypothetical protein